MTMEPIAQEQYFFAKNISQSISENRFWHTHFIGTLETCLMRLFGRNAHLRDLHQALDGYELKNSHYLGIQTIPIDRICGSEGRSHVFDRKFRPLSGNTMDRWNRIDRAYDSGVELPPIILIEVRGEYYVRDGHHRISVACSNGQKDIDAEVIAWEVEPKYIEKRLFS